MKHLKLLFIISLVLLPVLCQAADKDGEDFSRSIRVGLPGVTP